MNLLAQLAALVAGLFHVLVFCMESLWFIPRKTYRNFGISQPSDAQTVRPWAFNQGFYNLFLALGVLGGLIALRGDSAAAGRAVVLFCCACMLGAAAVLALTDRRMLRAAAMQGVPPLLALAASLA